MFRFLLFFFVLVASGQTFEVTSVKPHKFVGGDYQGVQPACRGGHFVAITPLSSTLDWAYSLQIPQQRDLQDQLPLWANSISGAYDLEATTRPDVTEKECRIMAQKLFEDRFRLKFHWETVTGPIYEMVVARGGFKMRPASVDDPASNADVTFNGRPSIPIADSPLWQGVSMEDMALRLSNNPRRLRVIDKTGIQGRYKFKIAYSMGTGDFADPDLITAVEQQFGLKLQEVRGPVPRFVVDSIEKPDTN